MARRARTKSIVGLEIEPGAVTAARVSVNGHLAVEEVASARLAPHVVRDGEVTDVEELAATLRALWREHKGLGRTVRVGVANARIVVRNMDLPPRENPKELEAMVRFHAEQELPMPLDSAVLDFQPVGTVAGPDGPRTRAVVVAARRDMVERVLAAVRSAGLRVEGVDLSAFGMIRALRRTDDPTLYLAIGGLTNIAVGDERGCSFTRVTGSGVEQMVLTLAERLQVPLTEARDLLVTVGLEAPLADFDADGESAAATRTVLFAGVRQIAGEVRSSLEFHQAQSLDGPAVSRVVLTGPAAVLPGFAAALSEEIGLPVETGVVQPATPAALGGLNPACAAVAAGLALTEAVA